MFNIFHKFSNLYSKSGFILFIIRIPIRVFFLIRNRINTFFWKLFLYKTGKNLLIEYGVTIENPKQMTLGNNVYIAKGTSFGSESSQGTIIIADNVHICKNCSIDHSGQVTIGNNVHISANTQIFSHSHGYSPKNKPIPYNITIEDNCWIGNNVIILEKTHLIKEFIIIGAGSIVTKPCIETNSLYTGSPATFQKHIS